MIMFQIITLARVYRSWSWATGAGAFVLLGAKQIKNFIRLPSAILEAQMKGVMIERLNWEQLIDVTWSYLIIAAFIVWLDWMKRDLEKLGVKV